ncbi:MAG TPA: transcript cleavage factor, partial [Rhabdochlamydiaceae bacterium]|nr:transcript cleavage factor [Rhabdochlamydiaceae bacterium]
MTVFQAEQNEGIRMGYLEHFESALENHDANALLRLWEEYTSSESVGGEDLKEILIAVKKSPLSDYIGRHVERILPLWQKLETSEISDEILKLILDLEETDPEQLRLLALDYLERKYRQDPQFNEKMRIVGMRGKGESFKGVISHFELLNHMKKGKFVFHTGGWGVGEVMDISMLREQVGIEFDYVPGRKDISFKNAFNCLIPIPDGHFLALRFGSPDVLEEKAKKNPVEVILMLLRDLGPKTAAEIKDELCELVIPAAEWNRWWQTARAKVKKNTLIESPEDLSQPFRLLKKEISHEEKLYKALETKPDADTLIQLVYSFMRDFSESLKSAQFKTSLLEKLKELLSTQGLTKSQEIQLHFFIQDLSNQKDYPFIKEQIKNWEAPADILKEISIQAFKKRSLTEIKQLRSDWKEVFLKMLFIVDQIVLRDYLLTELLATDAKNATIKKLEELAAHPSQNPEAVIWYFQKIIADPKLPFGDAKGASRFFEALLVLLSYLEQTGSHRELIKKIQSILSAGRFATVRQIMKDASLHDVQEFLLLVTKCHSLSDHDMKIFHSLAEVVYPTLAKKGKKKEAEVEEEVIWTTQEGYHKLQKRIEKIATEETVENAKEIEVARSHGDLRENAEFKSALEKRDRLQAELKFLS